MRRSGAVRVVCCMIVCREHDSLNVCIERETRFENSKRVSEKQRVSSGISYSTKLSPNNPRRKNTCHSRESKSNPAAKPVTARFAPVGIRAI